ncbi:MAG TPA: TspO/MBR family protein [Pyrinomonadaceae bacterium]|nr:TspO/MBR family protein [Pyrinomonadaceae bacterium]
MSVNPSGGMGRRSAMSGWTMWAGLIIFVAVCFAVAGLGSLSTNPSIDNWYAALAKPSWNPPNRVFGPVWAILYLMMAIAAWLVWRRKGSVAAADVPLALFAVQLVLNALWSYLFFGLHRPDLAFAEIVLLWAAILATLLAFRRVIPLAGWLLLPYLLWVTFGAFLNFTIWRLNQ